VVVCRKLFTHPLEPDCKQYLAQIARILKPGGRAIISINGHPRDGMRFDTREGVTRVDEGYFAELGRDAGLSLVERVGLVYGQAVSVFRIKTAAAP